MAAILSPPSLLPLPEYVKKYASEEALRDHEQSSSESEMSELSDADEAQDMEL